VSAIIAKLNMGALISGLVSFLFVTIVFPLVFFELLTSTS